MLPTFPLERTNVMPKILPEGKDYSKLFQTLGINLNVNGSVNAPAEACPYCGGTKFSANIDNGLWQCFRCQKKGNPTDMIRDVHQRHLERTSERDYQDLRERRGGISLQMLRHHDLAYDKSLQRWLIPFKNREGNVMTLQLYYLRDGRKMNLPGIGTYLFNFNALPDDKKLWVFLCEGPFDAIALDYALDTKRDRYVILAIPGTFKEEWVSYFAGRKVRCLFDNDAGGKIHNERVEKLLAPKAAELTFLRWPEEINSKDINDLVRDQPKLSLPSFFEQHSVKAVKEPKLIFTVGKRPVTRDRRDYIWPNRLPCDTYVSLSGKRGTFKSSIAREIAARYTRGEPMPLEDKKSMPAGRVLYVHPEEDSLAVDESFERAGGNFDYWHNLSCFTRDNVYLNVLDFLEEIEGMIRRFGIRLVIIDGQNSVVGAPNISTDMTARNNVTNKLHHFAMQTHICLLGLRNEDDNRRALGPQSMSDIARCIMRTEELSVSIQDEVRTFNLEWVRVSEVAASHYDSIRYSVDNRKEQTAALKLHWGTQAEEKLRKEIET
jgi:hypothetical protein